MKLLRWILVSLAIFVPYRGQGSFLAAVSGAKATMAAPAPVQLHGLREPTDGRPNVPAHASVSIRYRTAVTVASQVPRHPATAAVFSASVRDQVPPLLSDNIFHPPVVS